ncbi:hypothetical protein quinque_006832 [Culex quinquefasciatus]
MKRSSSRRTVACRDAAKGLVLDYCSNSSVHGVQYFGCRERSGCEKFWWFAVFLLSLGSCALLIEKTYLKWDQTPVIVSFNERATPVWQIPLPAVTICPQTKALATKLNFSNDVGEFMHNHDISGEKMDTLLATLQLCDRNFHQVFFDPSVFPDKTTNQSYASLIKDMPILTQENLGDCSIRSELTSCANLFSYSLTEEGVCVTFNGLSANELLRTENIQTEDSYLTSINRSTFWTQEDGYSQQATVRTYPYRSLGSGISAGISVTLQNHDFLLEYLCSGPNPGYKILLHSPVDYPHISNKFVRISRNREIAIAVKPQIITTSTGLRDYTPEGRQCFFNHERYLQFFREYTQNNCELECLTNFTLYYCGCVRFSMLRTPRTAVCETNQIMCMLKAEETLLEMDVVTQGNSEPNFRAKCNCLPACTSVQYDLEVTQTELEWYRYWETFAEDLSKLEGTQMARLGVYYKESQFITSRRSELYGLTDFLANCGGLLGLCMGVSLLSLVELLYFCLVRPVVLWRNQKTVVQVKNKDEAPEKVLLAKSGN